MKKKYILLVGASILLVGVLGFVFLYFYGFSISRPSYDAEYFTQEYLEKYNSPEVAWEHHINALTSDDAEYYQETPGRMLTEEERKYLKEHPYDGWKKPEIVYMKKRQNYAYIVTDNNWGEFFEKVNGRWVFTPEDWGTNIRAFFRTL
jgi:hypothetical protein